MREQQPTITNWLRQASIEIMPSTNLSQDALAELVMPGQKVYITYMANSSIEQVTDLVKRLQAAGAEPVAHIPARQLVSQQQLQDYVQALHEYQVEHVLLLAGGPPQPAGPYSDSMELLQTGLFDGQAFKSVGFAAHPHGHPYTDQATLEQAMQYKIDWASRQDCSAYFITQFVFEAKPLLQWLDNVDTSNMLPIDIGLPGITRTKTLLRFASIGGISWQQIMSMIVRHPWQWFKFLTQWSPEPIIETLAHYYQQTNHSQIAGLHFYTFGGFKSTAKWLKRYQTKEGENL